MNQSEVTVRRFPAYAGLPAAATVSVVVVTIIWLHPYFGNMDDGGLLGLAESGGPLYFASYLAGGPETGFIRATSMVIVWPTYWLGTVAGPLWFYLTNTILVFACLVAFGLAIARLLGWKSAWLGTLFLAATLLWPYTAELFFYPSLSEKGIILGAALISGGLPRLPGSHHRSPTGSALLQ